MKIDGKNIESVSIYHEQLFVRTYDGGQYFLSMKELLPMVHEYLFKAELKRTRTWLYPVTPDVDLLYEKYPDQDENVN